jgi:hypothetical protein
MPPLTMTIFLWWLGGAFTALIINYILHQPNKDYEKKMEEYDRVFDNIEGNINRKSNH